MTCITIAKSTCVHYVYRQYYKYLGYVKYKKGVSREQTVMMSCGEYVYISLGSWVGKVL